MRIEIIYFYPMVIKRQLSLIIEKVELLLIPSGIQSTKVLGDVAASRGEAPPKLECPIKMNTNSALGIEKTDQWLSIHQVFLFVVCGDLE
ncbi:MAG: hypothetical protein ACI8ZB_004198 [Desulforhopalus sp.]